MIPKIIHYCWFGKKPLPKLAKKCIASWKKYLPDYEIKEWNEDNFDVNIIPYTKEAYEAKKYAFVSDFARFWILYNYGGIYFDTDVEVIKNIDHIIAKGNFMGCEKDITIGKNDICVNPGLGLGTTPGNPLYKEMLALYTTLTFVLPDGSYNVKKTIVGHTTDILKKYGFDNSNTVFFIANTYIYPIDYFGLRLNENGNDTITENTVSIHHYAGTWLEPKRLRQKKISRFIGQKATKKIVLLKHFLRKHNIIK